jgi:hypothetical protein
MKWRTRAVIGAILGAGLGAACKPASGQVVQPVSSMCRSTPAFSAGGAIGRSSGDLELALRGTDPAVWETWNVRPGAVLWTARADAGFLSVLRARVEGSATQWAVERRSYIQGDDPLNVTSTPAGHMGVRTLRAAIGPQFQSSRTPMCGYFIAGVSTQSMSYQGNSARHGGRFGALGLEFPTGDHGHVQAEVQLNLIGTSNSTLISSSTTLALGLSVGWMYRF